jgi:acyl-CoA thioesterase YciA
MAKRIPIHRKRMRSENANDSSNRVFGGHILAEIDEAAVFAAEQLSPTQQFFTIAVDRVIFKKKVLVRDILRFYTTITHVGNSSVKVHVEVETTRDGQTISVTSADVTMVAVDENEQSTRVKTRQRNRINKKHVDEHCVPKCEPSPVARKATPQPRNYMVALDVQYDPDQEGDRAAANQATMHAIAAFRTILNNWLKVNKLTDQVAVVAEHEYLGTVQIQTTPEIAERIRQLPGVDIVSDEGPAMEALRTI